MKEELNLVIWGVLILIKTHLTRVFVKSNCPKSFILMDSGKEDFWLGKAQGLKQKTRCIA